MIDSVRVLRTVFMYFTVFSILILVISYLLTRKFDNRFRKVYILFMGLSFKEVFLFATTFLNQLLLIYFIININYYWPLGLYMIVSTNFLSCLFSFNIRVIMADIGYTSIACGLLWLLTTIISYYNYLGSNQSVLVLISLLIIMIIVYSMFVTIRKVGLLVNLHKGGVTNGR